MAALAPEPVPTFRPRQLVRHTGMTPAEPPVRVWRVTRSGVWVTLGDGRRVCWHPDDVRGVREEVPGEPG